MRSVFIAAFASAMTFGVATETFAADAGLCEAYTKAALQMAKEANRLGCGLDPNDPRWSMDPKVHNEWCLSASTESVMTEWGPSTDPSDPYYMRNSPKQQIMAACRICSGYVQKALAQEAEEQRLHCHLAGTSDRWPKTDSDGDIFSKHMRWCMGLAMANDAMDNGFFLTPSDPNREDITDKENAARDADLQQCKANYTGPRLDSPTAVRIPSSPRTKNPKMGATGIKRAIATAVAGCNSHRDACLNGCAKLNKGDKKACTTSCEAEYTACIASIDITKSGAAGNSKSGGKAAKSRPGGDSSVARVAHPPNATNPALLGPGLLDGGGGLGGQGPAAAGTPGASGGGATYRRLGR